MTHSEVVFRKRGGGYYSAYRRGDNRYLGTVSAWFGQWVAAVGNVHSYQRSRREAGDWLLARAALGEDTE